MSPCHRWLVSMGPLSPPRNRLWGGPIILYPGSCFNEQLHDPLVVHRHGCLCDPLGSCHRDCDGRHPQSCFPGQKVLGWEAALECVNIAKEHGLHCLIVPIEGVQCVASKGLEVPQGPVAAIFWPLWTLRSNCGMCALSCLLLKDQEAGNHSDRQIYHQHQDCSSITVQLGGRTYTKSIYK